MARDARASPSHADPARRGGKSAPDRPDPEPEVIEIEDDLDCADFDAFDDLLEDGVTEDELLLACDVDGGSSIPPPVPPATSHSANTNGKSVTATTTRQKQQQTTINFHIGPSAAAHSILNCSVIEDDIPGFDPEAGEMWIYPTNYPVRDYQFNIVKKALFVNTLVCLPTGLGKTFIAAVVMYNFYRWYPNRKIVFLAPTKPLVAQQIEACHKVMGIPQRDVAEMTGELGG